jgi:hypothetical protein
VCPLLHPPTHPLHPRLWSHARASAANPRLPPSGPQSLIPSSCAPTDVAASPTCTVPLPRSPAHADSCTPPLPCPPASAAAAPWALARRPTHASYAVVATTVRSHRLVDTAPTSILAHAYGRRIPVQWTPPSIRHHGCRLFLPIPQLWGQIRCLMSKTPPPFTPEAFPL